MLLKGQGPCRQDPLKTSAVLVRKTNMQHAPETVDEQYRTSLHLLQQQSAEGKSRYNGCCGDPFHPHPPQDRSLVHEQPNEIDGPLQG